MKTTHKRTGFSRIGLVVVVLMVVLVVGLFLVFLRWSWERANRFACMNNLRVVGMATFAFHEKQRFLPASCIDKEYATWAVQIAPYLSKAVWDDKAAAEPNGPPVQMEPFPSGLLQWQMPETYYAQTEEVRTAQIPFYYCPARRRPGQISVSGDTPGGAAEQKHHPGALGDYGGCSGDGGDWTTAEANGSIIIGKVVTKENGRILEWEGRIRLTAEFLPRGEQYTILFGEKHVPLGEWGQAASGDGSLYNGSRYGNFARIGGPGHSIAKDITAPYNRNFGSYHPGVCYFLFADGGVRDHSPAMSETVLGRLTNRLE